MRRQDVYRNRYRNILVLRIVGYQILYEKAKCIQKSISKYTCFTYRWISDFIWKGKMYTEIDIEIYLFYVSLDIRFYMKRQNVYRFLYTIIQNPVLKVKLKVDLNLRNNYKHGPSLVAVSRLTIDKDNFRTGCSYGGRSYYSGHLYCMSITKTRLVDIVLTPLTPLLYSKIGVCRGIQ